MTAVPLLRSISLFEGLSSQDLAELGDELQRSSFKAGTMVFHQGDAGDAMYIVESGEVNIHLPGDGSRRISLKDIARGEYFGELALFDEKPRSASATQASANTSKLLLSTSNDTAANVSIRPRK